MALLQLTLVHTGSCEDLKFVKMTQNGENTFFVDANFIFLTGLCHIVTIYVAPQNIVLYTKCFSSLLIISLLHISQSFKHVLKHFMIYFFWKMSRHFMLNLTRLCNLEMDTAALNLLSV